MFKVVTVLYGKSKGSGSPSLGFFYVFKCKITNRIISSYTVSQISKNPKLFEISKTIKSVNSITL